MKRAVLRAEQVCSDVLIEGGRFSEHFAHVSDRGRVPIANVLIESVGVLEHASHVCHVAGIPAANVGIECSFIPEGLRHVSHSPSTPFGDVAVVTEVVADPVVVVLLVIVQPDLMIKMVEI